MYALHNDGNIYNLLSRFLIDTGATEHLTNSKLIFKSFDRQPGEIKCANKNGNANFRSEGVGSIEVLVNDNKILKIDNVIYAENLTENLRHCKSLLI